MGTILDPKAAYIADEKYEERLKFATKAIEAVYQIDGPLDLKTDLRKKLFWATVWLLTESSGKYSTRYRSKSSLMALQGDIQHEHVFPISHIYYLSRHGLSVGDALGMSCACVVTRREHELLSIQDKTNDAPLGWMRYERAGIEVVDMLENRQVPLPEMEVLNAPFISAMRNARFCGFDGEVDLELERRERAGPVHTKFVVHGPNGA